METPSTRQLSRIALPHYLPTVLVLKIQEYLMMEGDDKTFMEMNIWDPRSQVANDDFKQLAQEHVIGELAGYISEGASINRSRAFWMGHWAFTYDWMGIRWNWYSELQAAPIAGVQRTSCNVLQFESSLEFINGFISPGVSHCVEFSCFCGGVNRWLRDEWHIGGLEHKDPPCAACNPDHHEYMGHFHGMHHEAMFTSAGIAGFGWWKKTRGERVVSQLKIRDGAYTTFLDVTWNPLNRYLGCLDSTHIKDMVKQNNCHMHVAKSLERLSYVVRRVKNDSVLDLKAFQTLVV